MKQSTKVAPKNEINGILQRISIACSLEEGRVSWKSRELDNGSFDLICSLNFKPQVDDHVKDGAIWHVLNECARTNDFSEKYFLRRLREFIHAQESKIEKIYTGICQINCTKSAGLPNKIRSLDGFIEFKHKFNATEQSAVDKMNRHDLDGLMLHDNFMFATIRIKSIDDRSAIDNAYRNIKFGFGLLNLYHLGYGLSKRFGFPHAPIGKFLSASTTFIIDRKVGQQGNFRTENYYPSAYKNNFTVRFKIDEDGKRGVSHYVKDMKRIDYADKIIQSIILLQEGLETQDINTALLKFWTGIELLCSRDEKEISSKIIHRASSIFHNSPQTEIRLRFIQEFRNKLVHKGDTGEHAILCAQWGSIYLSGIIRFCLFNKYRIYEHDDVIKYMSMPMDSKKIKRDVDLHNIKLKSISERLNKDAL